MLPCECILIKEHRLEFNVSFEYSYVINNMSTHVCILLKSIMIMHIIMMVIVILCGLVIYGVPFVSKRKF